jgi:pyruvate,water dikinase
MIRAGKIFFLLYFLFPVFIFPQQKKAKIPLFLTSLKNREDFDLMKGEPLSKTFKGIECIKIIYVLDTKTLYYVESRTYRWHYSFAADLLRERNDLQTFDYLNYGRSPQRAYILATFNYNVNTKNYFVQFAAPDDPSDEMIDKLVGAVTATFFKGKDFKILLNSTVLLRRKKEIAQKHSVITGDEFFKNQVYQPICKGSTNGILKFIAADSLKQNVNYSKNILVLKGTSNQIPICKGVVTDEFQTPLSHICLLTNNRKTPSAAKKNIFTDAYLLNLNGKFVELDVGEEKLNIYSVKESQEKNTKKKLSKALKADTVIAEIADLNTLGYKNRIAYGTKACNLAELKKLERRKHNISTPENAMGIPFYYYWQHIKTSGTGKLINELAKDTLALNNDSLLDKKLKKIRKFIRDSPIDKTFLDKISFLCDERFGKKKVRFRSSSNCEDEANFNGAGLYTSETGIVGDTGKSIEHAIKKVWASLWTIRAFKERSFFNIEHKTVCMGILVHTAFDNEILNGVAITKNLYRDYEFGFVINMQKGEEEVVSPKQGMICEQVVSYMNNMWADFYNSTRSADWISFSSLNPGSSLITSEELLQLTQQLESIKKHFYDMYHLFPKTEYKDFALDVEFKLIETADKKRKFVFKQARPYNN